MNELIRRNPLIDAMQMDPSGFGSGGMRPDFDSGGENFGAPQPAPAPEPELNPNGPAFQALMDHLGSMPERGKTGTLPKILAAVSGALGGLTGQMGAGLNIAGQFTHGGYDRALGDWKTKGAALEKASDDEHMRFGDAIRQGHYKATEDIATKGNAIRGEHYKTTEQQAAERAAKEEENRVRDDERATQEAKRKGHEFDTTIGERREYHRGVLANQGKSKVKPVRATPENIAKVENEAAKQLRDITEANPKFKDLVQEETDNDGNPKGKFRLDPAHPNYVEGKKQLQKLTDELRKKYGMKYDVELKSGQTFDDGMFDIDDDFDIPDDEDEDD